ncbi:MAG: AgmX/PglI C-terminal domain-containing protein [Deltaproteobacteria bacterium]|nr:AgmX/PglI C-terminal domain-containing protein [Deltaproteobacteria bacterium]
MTKRTRSLLSIVALLCLAAGGVFAQEADSFKARFSKLSKSKAGTFKVSARPGEEVPEATLNLAFGPGSTISVSRGNAAPKAMLEETDIVSVVNRNLRAVKFCYCKALKSDPEFEGQAIVGMKIKTTGKVEKVSIEPEDMAEHKFGKCLGPRVAKWRFPRFTGSKEDGLTVKSIGYEFPLEFNQAE